VRLDHLLSKEHQLADPLEGAVQGAGFGDIRSPACTAH
jgi:hypothetical protein